MGDCKLADKVSFTFIDRTNERSTMALSIPDVDETNWVETDTRVIAIQAALEALTLCNISKRTISAETLVNDTQPSAAYAQREHGLRLFARETSAPFRKFHFTVPGPDLTVVNVLEGDVVDIQGIALVNALVAAIEAAAVSPDGNAFEVYRARYVGRRN